MRKQADAAELGRTADPIASPPAPSSTQRTRKPATRRQKEPLRLIARWGVFDGGMKQLASFDYNQRALADQKVAELTAKKATAVYFVQLVKEPMTEPQPA